MVISEITLNPSALFEIGNVNITLIYNAARLSTFANGHQQTQCWYQNLKWGFILNICVFSFANSIPRWMHHIWLYVVFWLSWCWPMLLITARLTQLIFGDHIITPVPARQFWRRSMNISSWFNRKGQNNHNNTKHNISMCIFHGP